MTSRRHFSETLPNRRPPIQRYLNMIARVEDMVSDLQNNPVSPKEYTIKITNLNKTNKTEDTIHMFKIPMENLNKSYKKKLSEVKLEPFQIVPELRKAVETLKNRLAKDVDTPINIPNFRRFKPRMPEEGLIGPGSYDPEHKSFLKKFELISTPKFEEKMMQKLSIINTRRKSMTLEETAKVTIFDYYPPMTAKNNREKAITMNQKIETVQQLGKQIKQYNHETRKIKLEEKLERIKWLQRKDEIIAVKKTWRKIISEISIASLLHLKLKNRIVKHIQMIKKRSKHFIHMMHLIVKFIGKTHQIITRKRLREYYRVRFI